MRVLSGAAGNASSRTVELEYAEGIRMADFGPVIAQGGVFEPLRDPAFFEKVAVDPSGRFIEWPGGLDFCADALWEQSRPVEEAA